MNIVAGILAGTGPGAGWRCGPDEAAGGHIIPLQDVSQPAAKGGMGCGVGRQGDPMYTLQASTVHGIAAYGGNNTSGPRDVASALSALSALSAHGGASGRMDFETETFVAHTLRGEGFDASEDGTGRGTPLVPVLPIDMRQASRGATMNNNRAEGSNGAAQGMAVDTISRPTLDKSKHPGAMQGGAVRRLMPVECERLMGFPDGYTAIPWRGKPASECPDGPRYKALGNSWAVNAARWVGWRIATVDGITNGRNSA